MARQRIAPGASAIDSPAHVGHHAISSRTQRTLVPHSPPYDIRLDAADEVQHDEIPDPLRMGRIGVEGSAIYGVKRSPKNSFDSSPFLLDRAGRERDANGTKSKTGLPHPLTGLRRDEEGYSRSKE
jgi:hypothetical protein